VGREHVESVRGELDDTGYQLLGLYPGSPVPGAIECLRI